jgi:hypothetical protein
MAYFLSTQTFGNLKKSKFYKYHAYMIYTNKGMLLAALIVTYSMRLSSNRHYI